jgi:pimeloyl-ACP methyl ester carboxylesterase
VLVDSYGYMGKIPYGRLSYLIVRAPLVNELTWWSVKYSRSASAYLLSTIFGDPNMVTPEIVDEVFATLKQPNAGRAFTSFQRSEVLTSGELRSNFMDRLGELSMPVLFIQGEKDRLVPLALTREAQQHVPGSRLEVIPGAGHWPNRENPDVFNRSITTFLAD